MRSIIQLVRRITNVFEQVETDVSKYSRRNVIHLSVFIFLVVDLSFMT